VVDKFPWRLRQRIERMFVPITDMRSTTKIYVTTDAAATASFGGPW
jgi:hypothetical protein